MLTSSFIGFPLAAAARLVDRFGRAATPLRPSWLARAMAAVTGLLLGFAMGLPLTLGQIAPAIAVVVVGLGIIATIRAVIPAEYRSAVGAIVGLAFALRVASAVGLYLGSLTLGQGGFWTGDDMEYASLAYGLAEYLKGSAAPPYVPPDWNGHAWFFGTFAYLETAIFFLVGPSVLVPEILNGGLAVAAILLVFAFARQLFGARSAYVATVLVAFYPSLVLWSAMNLKDALTWLIVSLAFWLLMRFVVGGSYGPLITALALLWPMKELRLFTFIALSIAILSAIFAVILATRSFSRAIVARLFFAGAATALAVALGLTPSYLAIDGLRQLEQVRQATAREARTGFSELAPIIVNEGDTFVVPAEVEVSDLAVDQIPVGLIPSPFRRATPPASPGASPQSRRPRATVRPEPQRIVYVSPGTKVVLSATAASAPNTVNVQPGDLLVVGPPGTAPAPEEERAVLITKDLTGDSPSAQLEAPNYLRDDRLVLQRTLAHIPQGILYTLFAPFPWDIRRTADVLIVPEMLVWYAVVVAGLWTLWSRWRAWRRLLPLALFVTASLGILVLVEGNVGSLFRHRATVIPYAIVLAAPTLLATTEALRARLRAWHASTTYA